MHSVEGIRARRFRGAGFLAGALCLAAPAGALDLDVSGFAWTQYLNGLTPMYKGAANFDYQPFFFGGGMLFLNSKPAEAWEANVSLGVAYRNSAIKRSMLDSSGTVPISKTNPHSISLGTGPFLHEANVAFQTGPFALKVGKFHYIYSDLNHNMGLYLLRGPVYPGFLYSGFFEIEGLTKTGVLSTLSFGPMWRWDVLGSFETEFKPYMDLNLSTFITMRAGPLELGAGIEMQRLVEFNPCVTSPTGKKDIDECLGGDPGSSYVGPGEDLYKGAFMVIDTLNGAQDTTTFSLAGTKVMVRGALDFKKFGGSNSGSPGDNVLYFEAALIGVRNYDHLYEKRGERIPVLAGYNFPTFGLLDLLSLEVEYYNAPFQNDPHKLVGAYDVFQFSDGNSINYAMSPIPSSNKAGSAHIIKATEDFDPKKDNWKWSVHAKKTVHKKIAFKAQVASDHWRAPNNNFVNYEQASNPGQFYGAVQVEYGL